MALHPNFDTRDDCSKRVHRPGAYRVRWMMIELTSRPGKNRGMHPHRVQLLHAEVTVHPHRVQMHPDLVHFGAMKMYLSFVLLDVLFIIYIILKSFLLF